jgi:hypothetical protein
LISPAETTVHPGVPTVSGEDPFIVFLILDRIILTFQAGGEAFFKIPHLLLTGRCRFLCRLFSTCLCGFLCLARFSPCTDHANGGAYCCALVGIVKTS